MIEQENYVLRCPEEMLQCERYEDLRRVESIVVRILRTYITEFYSSRKKAWERTRMTYEDLTEDDDNLLDLFEARVRKSATSFLNNLLDELERVETEDGTIVFEGQDGWYEGESGPPPRVYFDRHLYLPLVTEEDDTVKYSPPGLNTGEKAFVADLREFLSGATGQTFMEDRKLYVLRNQSRGHGVGFQMEGGGRFYPDFILWLLTEDLQHIMFVDPKGLNVGMGDVEADPKVSFCKDIKSYQDEINQRSGRDDIRLHAYLMSTTPFQTLKENQSLQNREQYADRHIYFQEDGPSAVGRMLRRVLS